MQQQRVNHYDSTLFTLSAATFLDSTVCAFEFHVPKGFASPYLSVAMLCISIITVVCTRRRAHSEAALGGAAKPVRTRISCRGAAEPVRTRRRACTYLRASASVYDLIKYYLYLNVAFFPTPANQTTTMKAASKASLNPLPASLIRLLIVFLGLRLQYYEIQITHNMAAGIWSSVIRSFWTLQTRTASHVDKPSIQNQLFKFGLPFASNY